MVRLSLFQKLFFSLLASNVILIAGMAYILNVHFREGLQNYLNHEDLLRAEQLSNEVSHYYSPTTFWQNLKDNPRLWQNLLDKTNILPPPKRDANFKNGKPNARRPQPLSSRMGLLDINNQPIFEIPLYKEPSMHLRIEKIAIKKDEQVIGWIVFPYSEGITNALAENFFNSQRNNLLKITIITLITTLFVAFIWMKYLLRPLKSLYFAVNKAKKGNYDSKINYKGHDEIADLVLAFNELIASLKAQRIIRDQWLSDISHELRTPLTILQGEIEALQDGIRHADDKYIAGLHHQVINLNKLVNDLHELSLTDVAYYQTRITEAVNVNQLLKETTDIYHSRFQDKQITLNTDFSPEHLIMNGDSKKIRQLLINLLENSYHYTQTEGQVSVISKRKDDRLMIIIEDSAPAVPEESLPKLFDRLYRVSKSRNRHSGGSGLGLSICKSIVEMHHGEITVAYSSLGGLKMTIFFKILEQEPLL